MQRLLRGAVAVALSIGMAIGAADASVPSAKTNFTASDNMVKLPKKKWGKQATINAQRHAQKSPQVRSTDGRQLSCGDFFSCLFGPQHSRRRSASYSGFAAFDQDTREEVSWSDPKHSAGSIVIRTPERALYYVLPGGRALRYRVGVGREGFQWSGSSRIVMKLEWPSWHPPRVMIEREAAKGHMIPEFMDGGPNNPLGARAMYIGGTLFRIHGTNDAASIGGAVSSGCIRMMNADVIDLYERVRIGSRVYVYQ